MERALKLGKVKILVVFKFHYVQMELPIIAISSTLFCLNSTMFRWNDKIKPYETGGETSLNSTMFRWN